MVRAPVNNPLLMMMPSLADDFRTFTSVIFRKYIHNEKLVNIYKAATYYLKWSNSYNCTIRRQWNWYFNSANLMKEFFWKHINSVNKSVFWDKDQQTLIFHYDNMTCIKHSTMWWQFYLCMRYLINQTLSPFGLWVYQTQSHQCVYREAVLF